MDMNEKARRLTALTVMMAFLLWSVMGLIEGHTMQLWMKSFFHALFIVSAYSVLTWIIKRK
jgi:hypothetical protein